MENLTNLFSQISIEPAKAQITLPQKGQPQLHFKGHYFRLPNTKKVNPPFSWRCKVSGCKITGKTEGKSVSEQYDFTVS